MPVPGTDTQLPLDLQRIAVRCPGAYYSPNRFRAVQIAFSDPRCRVLVFHTGKLVGTGTSGVDSSRLALLMTQAHLRRHAGVHITLENFSVINIVGAVNIGVALDVDRIANQNRSRSHLDKANFVGLIHRFENEPICVEAYDTGRMNIPGATDEQMLIDSFGRNVPKLLRYKRFCAGRKSSRSTTSRATPTATETASKIRTRPDKSRPSDVPRPRSNSALDVSKPRRRPYFSNKKTGSSSREPRNNLRNRPSATTIHSLPTGVSRVCIPWVLSIRAIVKFVKESISYQSSMIPSLAALAQETLLLRDDCSHNLSDDSCDDSSDYDCCDDYSDDSVDGESVHVMDVAAPCLRKFSTKTELTNPIYNKIHDKYPKQSGHMSTEIDKNKKRFGDGEYSVLFIRHGVSNANIQEARKGLRNIYNKVMDRDPGLYMPPRMLDSIYVSEVVETHLQDQPRGADSPPIVICRQRIEANVDDSCRGCLCMQVQKDHTLSVQRA